MSSSPIRVAVVDDDLFVRTALGGFLATARDFELVGQVENGEEAVVLATSTRVDVMLMDVQMPGLGGVAAVSAVGAASPSTRILMLTSFDEEASVHAALAAGARGFLLKSTSPAALIEAVRAVHAGTSVLSDGIVGRFGTSRQPAGHHPARWSARERQVLALLCEGHSNAEIAAALYISESTVKMRLAACAQKLGTNSRVATAIRAWELGLGIDPGRH